MRISDWSSDVCSSDLRRARRRFRLGIEGPVQAARHPRCLHRGSEIAPWNRHISQFSDDGVVFAGAYGPRINLQLDYVLNKLREDPDTRQAGLTIWRPNPQPSKDIPCKIGRAHV